MLRWHARPFGSYDEDDGDFDSLLTDDSVTDIGGEDEAEEEIRESRAPVAPVRRLSVQIPVHKAGKPAVQPAGKTAAPSAARKVRKATVKTATKKAAPKKAAVKKAAPKKAAPKKAAPKKAAPKKAAVKKAAAPKPAKKAAPKKAAVKKAK
jgi:hypothetical protein